MENTQSKRNDTHPCYYLRLLTPQTLNTLWYHCLFVSMAKKIKHVTCDAADLEPPCLMWEGWPSVWQVVLILPVESFTGWLTVKAISEWAHPGFLLIIQEKLIKVKGKNSAAAEMKNVLYCGFSSSLLFFRLAFLSPYVMLAESGSVVYYQFFWVVCMCVCVSECVCVCLSVCVSFM